MITFYLLRLLPLSYSSLCYSASKYAGYVLSVHISSTVSSCISLLFLSFLCILDWKLHFILAFYINDTQGNIGCVHIIHPPLFPSESRKWTNIGNGFSVQFANRLHLVGKEAWLLFYARYNIKDFDLHAVSNKSVMSLSLLTTMYLGCM